jgi:hypothetical protein
MARVRFTADFDYRPVHGLVIAYKAGMEITVKRECCDQAVAKGKAVKIPPTKKDHLNEQSTSATQKPTTAGIDTY